MLGRFHLAERIFLGLFAQVKVCGYCGGENADDAASCSRCGSILRSSADVPTAAESQSPPVVPPPLPEFLEPTPQPRMLKARTATLILVAYFGAQFAGGLIGGMVGGVVGAMAGKDDSVRGADLKQTTMVLAVLLGFVAGGVAMVLTSMSLLRDRLKDRSPTGAAWVAGSFKQMVQGFGIGTLVAIGYCGLASYFVSKDAAVGPLTKMATTPGISQITWLLMAFVLAPPIEELLFRGVLYGGYRKSFGPAVAAILTTLMFTLLHISEIVYSWPAAGAIIGLALTALWARLRSGAIGPAVGVHLGYNAVIGLLTVFASLTSATR